MINTNVKQSALRFFAFALLIAAMLIPVAAQAQNQVKWRTTVKMISDKEGELTVRAIITDGWHMYGTKLPKGGPKPTVLDFSESTGIKFKGDFKPSVKPVEKMDAMFGIKLTYWSGNVAFTRPFVLTAPKADAAIKGKITYMVCDDETCMPPKTESVSLKIK